MTKIDIYSGFLGAGKTTLIKKMIKEAYHGQKLVLIENEFGEIGIDGGFLQEAGIQITEMNSGCICCSLVGDFGRALHKVIEEYHPDRILIEPSGVGKLSDVIGAVRKVTSDDVQLGNFVTVADATKCKMYMKNFGEFYNNQIETANTIILSRTDGMTEEKLDQCVAMIREHNKDAVVVTTPWDELTGEQLMEAMEQRSTIAIELAKLEEEAHHHQHDHDDEDEHEHHHHHHDDDEEHDCCCGHHHDEDDDEDEHEHHHHHHHDDDEECDDPECSCHHHHDEDEEGHEHHHHHHHHGHDADEVFISWGEETHKKYTKAEIEVFLLALLQHQQQRPFPGVEAGILQRLLDKAGLTGLQKAGENVHRNSRHGLSSHSAVPNSSATAFSFSFEPITQMRPVTIAQPSRMSGSPGT